MGLCFKEYSALVGENLLDFTYRVLKANRAFQKDKP